MSQTFSKKRQETHSQSGANSNKSQQTMIDGLDYQFDISVQNIMPFMSSIKQQNMQLSQQKNLLENDLKCLDNMTTNLFQQNFALKNHYNLRTKDLSNLTQSIILNTEQQVKDLEHLNYLVKSHNCKLVKSINNEIKTIKNIETELDNLRISLQQNITKNTKKQQDMRYRQVKVKQFEQRQKLLQKQNQNQLFTKLYQYQTQINTLQLQNHQIKNYNINLAQSLKKKHYRNYQDKPVFQAQSINLIKNNNQLKAQLVILQQDLKKFRMYNEQYEIKVKSVEEKFQKYQRQFEKRRLQCIEVTNTIEQSEQIKSQKLQQTKQLEKQLQKVEKQRYDLKIKIQQIKYQQQNKQKAFIDKCNLLKQQKSQKTQKIKKKIESFNISYIEIFSQLNPEIQSTQFRKQEIVQEHSELQKQIYQLKSIIKSTQNPMKQINRLQFQIKMRQRR